MPGIHSEAAGIKTRLRLGGPNAKRHLSKHREYLLEYREHLSEHREHLREGEPPRTGGQEVGR